MKELVIFDLDGTLLNTIADLAISTNYALHRCGFPKHREEEYFHFVGNGITKLFERALPEECRSSDNVSRVRSYFLEYYSVHNTDYTRPYDKVEELLSVLNSHGVKIAVASNKYQAGTQKLIQYFFPGIDFVSVLGQRDEDLKIAFESGAQMVTGGSVAVKDPELFCHWLEVYGSEKIILGADVKEHKIAVNGWKDESACELFPFLEDYINKGIQKVICTDISCDGMLKGPSIDLYKEMLEKFPNLYLMASGGVSNVDDIIALNEAGVPGVIFGKALYEGHITLKDLRIFL